ncbi:hypothetical protein [Telmatospirillum sp.]|uniref:hypothetical protein n=1 Tax=Telmatospirillum sp. TaxID=2079197 RepID=UPI00284745BC|nr:hypothetical protein [Telmatospirillum sp.]MDR3437941.1 hypothetical protein [Telmatospirillum sp.]
MASEQKNGADGAAVLRDRYVVYPGKPLPDLASPNAEAFHAEDRRDAKKVLFALIVRPGILARTDSMRALKGSDSPGLMTLVEWGTMDWPPLQRKVMAVVYERPTGGRVMATMTSDFKAVDEADLVRKAINPLFAALRVLRSHNVTHRAIRPTNMFWATPEKDRVVLGDCTTIPPAYEQPLLVETIESGMCQPTGRGPGVYADDIYSLGASMALLLQGRNPAGHLDDDTILRRKILQGSVAVLIGEERLSLQTSEFLRGTLCDDPHERWTTESIELWLSGRRLSPLLAKFEKRAARGMPFNGKEYLTARELAIAFVRNWDAVPQLVLDGRLELWVRRSLDVKEKAEAIAAITRDAVMTVNEKRGAAFDIMVAKVCMVLDSRAPIRYKSLAAMPDGIGAMLGMAVAAGTEVRIIAESLMREIPKAYFQTRETYNPDNSMLDAIFRDLKLWLEKGSIGSGIERVVYEMNDAMPCLSPLTLDDYVLDIRDLLPALDAAAIKVGGKGWPVDRHVAAFIAARAKFDVERQLFDLSQPNSERSAMAMLNILAVLQWRLGQGGLQGLATWLGSLMKPVINTFHDREKRTALEKDIPRIARDGNLVELSRVLDSPEEKAVDSQGFQEARAQWAEARREVRDIEEGHANNRKAIHFAQRLAALVSMTICLVTFSLLLLARLF